MASTTSHNPPPTTTNTTTATTTVELTAECLCKANRFTTKIPISRLPLSAVCCHCSSCRHITGGMYTCITAWPGIDRAELSSSKHKTLKSYPFTSQYNLLFCGTCSCPMFFDGLYGDHTLFGVFVGALNNNIDMSRLGDDASRRGLISIVANKYLVGTLDGGASPWHRNPNPGGGIETKQPSFWEVNQGESREIPRSISSGGFFYPPLSSLPDINAITVPTDAHGGPVPVPIQCHCKGVDLLLRSPRDQLREGISESGGRAWYIDRSTLKRLASFDACDSCRRVTGGVAMTHWTFSDLRHIAFPSRGGIPSPSVSSSSSSSSSPFAYEDGFPATLESLAAAATAPDSADSRDGQNKARDPRLGTLCLHRSSPNVQRYFCGRCSATVFYATDARPGQVNIAVGLLDSQDGVRAESYLSWVLGGPVSHVEDNKGGWREGLVEAMVKDAEEWRAARGYPVSVYREMGEAGDVVDG